MLIAERRGFEPLIRFRRIRAFQARLFNHSSTSPRMGKDNDFPAIDQISLLLIHRPARYFPATVGKRRSRMLQNPGKRHSFPLAPAHSPSGKRPRAL